MRNLTQIIKEASEGKETFEVILPDGLMDSYYYTEEDANKRIEELVKINSDEHFKPTIKKGNEKDYKK